MLNIILSKHSMYKTISSYDFHDAFTQSDWYRDSFSYEGREALFEYLEYYEESTGTTIELYIVDIACDYTEYQDAITAVDAYTEDAPYLLDEEELLEEDGTSIDAVTLIKKQNEKAIQYLEYRTQVIRIPESNTIIIQNYEL